MTDLISRQAAINLAKDICVPTKDGTFWRHRCIDPDDIRGLPSAQLEIVRCKDCKYQRKGQNECEAWNLCGYRPWQYTPITDEHFCSYAERRTE